MLVPQQLSGTGCSGPFFRLPVGVPQPGGDSANGLTLRRPSRSCPWDRTRRWWHPRSRIRRRERPPGPGAESTPQHILFSRNPSDTGGAPIGGAALHVHDSLRCSSCCSRSSHADRLPRRRSGHERPVPGPDPGVRGCDRRRARGVRCAPRRRRGARPADGAHRRAGLCPSFCQRHVGPRVLDQLRRRCDPIPRCP